jgi:hypothetical protein
MLPRRAAIGLVALAVAAESDIEFFEKRVRPVLAEKCYACHSARTTVSSGLALDTKAGVRKGGKRGPAIIPGQPDRSLLLRAISHADAALKMPPSGKLEGRHIADLSEWIRRGAEDPRDGMVPVSTVSRRDYWAFRPFRAHLEPKVRDRKWPANWVDYFILARLEARQLRPAPPADKRTLLRRVTFDLTGLPPTPAEMEAFLEDTSPKGYENVIERLLASSRYGERWARHWLDLARYAETDGHEFDREKPNAWRYRDYVIRAFNQDLPFDRFVREQIAGDLLGDQRFTPDGMLFESPVATSFFGLHEERNAADDLAEVRAEKIENQIDTLGKTFLGLTVACARCHDHKFDPISQRDYYALAGILSSKQLIQANIDSPRQRVRTQALAGELGTFARQMDEAAKTRRLAFARQSGAFLRSLTERIAAGGPDLDAEFTAALREPDHILYPLLRLAKPSPDESALAFAERLARIRAELAALEAPRPGDFTVADFASQDWRSWRFEGPAFVPDSRPTIPVASSFRARASQFTGFLYSQTFRAPQARYMHVRLAGLSDSTSPRQPGQLRVSLVGDGRDVAATADPSGRFVWKTSGMDKAQGELLFVELADRSRTGHLLVDKIIISAIKDPPRRANPRLTAMLDNLEISSLSELITAYQAMFELAAEQSLTSDLLSRWIAFDLDRFDKSPPAGDARHTELAARIEDPAFGLVSVDDKTGNARLQIAGSHRNLGDEVPRRFLDAFSGDDARPFTRGSGRLELAEAIASPSNPMTARVAVNRVWQHYFAHGLVRTPDNFGRMGEPPSHPELLDTMAAKLVEGGWSLKSLHRAIVLSSTYRMASRPDPRARLADPENRLLHHMPVRRLEGEAIRDAVLAVSGALDTTMHGPSVPPHISEYQDGRGKPQSSGPLDGNGRRSIYVGVRRNFLTPLLVAFDYPPTVTTIGRRGTSTVPAQALMLMNNEFVSRQAARWADQITSAAAGTRERIECMFLGAFGRPAGLAEITRIERFLADQGQLHKEDPGAPFRAWADLAHALLNSKEFIFLR